MKSGDGRGAVYRIGVISDTHGELPDDASEALEGAGLILHAGDVGGGGVLEALGRIAPVRAVRGNNRDASEARLPLQADVAAGGVRVVMAHQQPDLVRSRAIERTGARVAVSGHTHLPGVEELDGVLWVNPGSPSCPRRGAPRSVAIITVSADGAVEAAIVTLP